MDPLVNFLRPDPLTDGLCSSIQFVGAEEDEQGPHVPGESIVLNVSTLSEFVEETSTYLDDSGTSGLGFVVPGNEPEDPEDGSNDSEGESNYSLGGRVQRLTRRKCPTTHSEDESNDSED